MAEFEASLSHAPAAEGRLARATPLASLVTFASRFGLYLLLSSGLFYFAYKFYQPTYGGTDYFKYYPTYLHPLDLHVTPSPFVYRQLSAVLTHLVYRYGPYYDPQIFFSRPGYDQHVFFAAMLTNYLALALCAAVTAVAAERLRPGGGPAAPLFAGALCYLSFFAQQSGMGPITDGVAWLLVALGFLGYLNRSLITVGAVLVLAVFERETIPVMLGAIAAAHLVLSRERRRFDGIVILLCVAAFALYLGLRLAWAPVAGHEEQTQISGIAGAFAHWRLFVNGEVLFQGFLTQNLLILLALNLIWRAWPGRRTRPLAPEITRLILALYGAAAALVIVSFLTMIGQNVGRIIAMLTPVTATLLALALLPDERAPAAAIAPAS